MNGLSRAACLLLLASALFLGAARRAAAQQYIAAPADANAVTQTIYIPEQEPAAETNESQPTAQIQPTKATPQEAAPPVSAPPQEQENKTQTAAPKAKKQTSPKKKTVTQPGKFVPFFPVENAAYRNETESQEYLLSSPSVFPGVGLRPRRPYGGRKRPHRPGRPGGSHSGVHRPGFSSPAVPGRDPRLDAPPSGYKPVMQRPGSNSGRPGRPAGAHAPKPQGRTR